MEEKIKMVRRYYRHGLISRREAIHAIADILADYGVSADAESVFTTGVVVE